MIYHISWQLWTLDSRLYSICTRLTPNNTLNARRYCSHRTHIKQSSMSKSTKPASRRQPSRSWTMKLTWNGCRHK